MPVRRAGENSKLILEGEYDERCDLFSFGAILYFLLTGESPLVCCAITNQMRTPIKNPVFFV